jgi:predicted permease
MEWLRRLWYLLNRQRFDAELQAEMDAHRAMMAEPARFGNVRALREQSADVRGFRWLDEALRDARLGARSLRRTPGFAVVAVASLALAMAVVASAAAILNAYLIRPFPYPAADRLYHVMYAPPGPWEPAGLSGLDWSALSDVVEYSIKATGDTMFVTGSSTGGPSHARFVAPGFVEALGVRAEIVRTLGPDDFQPSDVTPVLISNRLWRDRFAGDSAAIGRDFQAELVSRGRTAARFRVVGVLPHGWWYGADSRDWVDVIAPTRAPARAYRIRLREGVPAAAAAQRITAEVRRLATDLPPTWAGVTLEPARDRYVSRIRPTLMTAGGATLLILAIACANLAVLTLLRALRRQKEIGVRLALGAGRGRLIRMLIVESLLLVAIATAAGLGLSMLALAAVGETIWQRLDLPAPGGLDALHLDATVVAMVAILGVVVAGVLPLFALVSPWQTRLAAVLRRQGRTSTDSPAARRWRSALVILQVAGSLALLVGCGLMIRSLANMVRAEYGINTSGLVRVSISTAERRDAVPADLEAFYRQIAARASEISGAPAPLFEWLQFSETPKQPISTDDGSAPVQIGVVPVTAPYFDALQIALRQGRLLTDADRLGTEPVAVVSESAARRLFPAGNAVGQRIRVADRYISGKLDAKWRTVVGIVADVRQTYHDHDEADIYLPFLQSPPGRNAWFYMRTPRPAREWEAALRDAVASVDPQAWIRVAVPLPVEASRQWAAPGFLTSLTGGFSSFAMLFAILGIYGVTAFSLQQRRREIAIRSALGASSARTVRTLLVEGGVVIGAGLALGLLVAGAVSRAIGPGLHDVGPFDPATYVTALGLLASAGFASIAVPALRAARRSPVATLNADAE